MDGQNDQKIKTRNALVLLTATAIILAAGYIIAQRVTNVIQPEPEGETGGVVDIRPEPEVDEADENVMRIYYIDIENKRGLPQTIGCGDSVGYLTVDTPIDELNREQFIETALGYLFEETNQNVGKGGLYNSLYQSNLTLAEVQIEDGTARIYIEGEIVLGGVCDNPRAEQQIRRTVIQVPGIMAVELFLNSEPLTFSQE